MDINDKGRFTNDPTNTGFSTVVTQYRLEIMSRRDTMALGIFTKLLVDSSDETWVNHSIRKSVKLADQLIAELDKPRDGK